MKKPFRAITLALSTLLIASCGFLVPDPHLLGSLSISAGAGRSSSCAACPARTVAPPASAIAVATYLASGAGPRGESFGPLSSSTGSLTVTGLLEGAWTVTVDGYNAESSPRRIATVTSRVEVRGGQTTEATLSLAHFGGSGSVGIDLEWPDTVASLATITLELAGSTGTHSQTLSRSGAVHQPASGRYATTATLQDIPTGSYSLSAVFRDAAGNRFGRPIMDVVNVYKGETSAGTYILGEENFPVEPPVFSPDGGSFRSNVGVTISCATPGAVIYYSKDGSPPSVISYRYATGGTITIGSTRTLRAVAVKAGMVSSEVTSATFTKREDD